MLVTTEWLGERLDRADLAVVDMRWREDGSGRALYERGHIPGAVYVDWSADIVDPDHPVAFMLAPPERFAAAMARAGIRDETEVVAYTDSLGSGPFRLWWAFKVYGHDTVRVLDGGMGKWLAEGRPLSMEEPVPAPAEWHPRPRDGLSASVADIRAAASGTETVVVDSRPPEQFRGEAVWFETGQIDADADGIARTPRGEIRAGRVPGAVGVPAARLYRDDHTMKSPEELRELLAAAGVPQRCSAVTYCGVGISASALLFALKVAGIEDVTLYDGSWDEWGRNLDLPIARG